ncbi:MAG: hypothetical protein OXN21_13755 [Chloroflexota bacterium]|nr:hypothetical protein [Chloroflexota bacterium]
MATDLSVRILATTPRGAETEEVEKAVEEFLSGAGNDESVARAIEGSWRISAGQYYEDLRLTLGEEVADAFRRTYLEVLSAVRFDDRQNEALVQVRCPGGQENFPLEIMMALLGCEPYWPQGMTLHPDYFSQRILPNGLMRLLCEYEGGKWVFKSREGEPRFVSLDEAEDLLAEDLAQQGPLGIGEPILLEFHYKEPPFALTVLGTPEAVDQETVRLPVRITSVIPKWAYNRGGIIGAMLRTPPNADGEFQEWSSVRTRHLLLGQSPLVDPFQDLVLIQGGTFEDYLYFEPCDEASSVSNPGDTFEKLYFLDEATEGEEIDLGKSTPAEPRAVFNDGRPAPTTLPANLRERVEDLGSFWSDLPDAAPAMRGDQVTILDQANGIPFIDLTVIGEPQRRTGISLRVPVRVVARYDQGPRNYYVDAQLSTPPDLHGRISHVFEAMSHHWVSQLPAEAINLEGMVMGEVREGFLYFAPNDAQAYTELPAEPFTLLWYGPDSLELPMDLTTSR